MPDVWVLNWEHRHGSDTAVFASREGAAQHRREIAAEQWDEEIGNEIPRPKDEEACANAYFAHMGDQMSKAEFCEISRHTLQP